MRVKHQGLIFVIIFLTVIFFRITVVPAASLQQHAQPIATPSGKIATTEEIAKASAEWAASAHSDTYDGGLGADTTCARCKSPKNWDPNQTLAAEEATDCYSCKRVPGLDRPTLNQGISVPKSDWMDIPCDICHIPQGNSYDKGIAYWNQSLGYYETVENKTELCAKCHEGQHGFEVIEEQEASSIHKLLECTDCHGNHGSASSCTDCHDPNSGPGAINHIQHPSVNCTACHDKSGLSIWFDGNNNSKHYGEYITRRFAHDLTSWPSHNLSSDIDCLKCHHMRDSSTPSIIPEIDCTVCHIHEDGAVQFWCTDFARDPDPFLSTSNDSTISSP